MRDIRAEGTAESAERKRLARNPPSFLCASSRHQAINPKNSLKTAQALDVSFLSQMFSKSALPDMVTYALDCRN
ncbi:hypothetical protein [Azospirillum formosense]|uniref:hypothetical protein n=1 Tax=Azospirillum formosense TaxID=861533 RepID=UPI00338F2B28